MRQAWVVVGLAATLGTGGTGCQPASAGSWATVTADADWCGEDGRGFGRGVRHCEVREFKLPAGARLHVDGAPNGGVDVRGERRDDVRVQARVDARAASADDARALAAQVTLSQSGVLRATGPRSGSGRQWSVSWRLWVPESSDLTLRAENGGLNVAGVSGSVDARTTNGGVHLEDVGGRVSAHTVNGGLHVRLSDGWRGQGLEARTTNGGVHLDLPRRIDARLEASTVNGPIDTDLPVRGGHASPVRIGGTVSADLGRGGPVLNVSTTNGPLHVERRP
jgi:hypothetical protein